MHESGGPTDVPVYADGERLVIGDGFGPLNGIGSHGERGCRVGVYAGEFRADDGDPLSSQAGRPV